MSNEASRAATTLEALSDDLANAVERSAPSVVAVHARHHVASSGTVWRTGVVVTAAHAIKREEEITVTTADGRVAAATLAGRDGGTDIAVLRVPDDLDRVIRTPHRHAAILSNACSLRNPQSKFSCQQCRQIRRSAAQP